MFGINPTYILCGGALMLIVLLNEKARLVAALLTFAIVLFAAVKVLGIDPAIWK
jgi:hypothetical protein